MCMLQAQSIESFMELMQSFLKNALRSLIDTDQVVQQLKEFLDFKIAVEDEETEHPASLCMELYHLSCGLVCI